MAGSRGARRTVTVLTRFSRLTPKLLTLVLASALGLFAAERPDAATPEEGDERRAAVAYRHFV